MLNENIIALVQKLFDGTASAEEMQQLHRWYDEWEDTEETVNTYPDDNTEESIRLRMLTHLKKQMMQQEQEPAKVISIKRGWYRFTAAASIILLLSIGAYFLVSKQKKQIDVVTNNTRPHDIAPPAATKAMITLADGRRVPLDSIQSGRLAKQDDVNVVKTADGQIVYSGSSGAIAYNILDNPRGSKVQAITLSDGTKAWLNSESVLRYPVYFKGQERKVELTGEAYFEVAKNAAMPFKVNVAGRGEVEVLGTHFNINSYNDEATINTTLLEGKIKLTELTNKNSTILAPGQQARLNTNGQIHIKEEVDVDEVMAWKNDMFNFNSLDIESIMRQVGRWYDVEVSFEGKISRETYSGILSRNSNMSQVLKILESGGVKYSVEGKKIIVRQ